MIQDKIFFDEKDPTGLSYNTPFTFYGSYQGRLWSKSPTGSIKYYTQNSDLSAYAITGSNQFSGSQTVTGSLTVTGTITGTVAGTTATASYVEYTNVANKPALISGSAQVTYSGLTGVPSGIVSGSSQVTYSGLTGIPSGIVSGSAQISDFGIFATTGSNGFNGSQSITGSLTVTGQVVAQTLNVQQVTSSIVYSSGSNIFGNSLGNTQQFTGSVSVTGSLAVAGTGTFSGALSLNSSANRVNSGNELRFYRTDNGIYTQLYDGGAANGFVLDNRNGDGFSFQTAGTNQLRIASTGAATFSSSVTATTLTLSTTTADYAATITNVQDSSQGLLVRATDNDTTLYLLNLQSSNGATSQTWVDRFTVTKGGNVGIGTPAPNRLTELISSSGGVLGVSTSANGSSVLYGRIAMYSNAGSNSYIDYGGEIRSYSGAGIDYSDLRFYTAGGSTSTERMRITSGGNNQYTGDPFIYSNTTAGGTAIHAGLRFNSTDKSIRFFTNDVTALDITSDKYIRMAASTGGIQFNGDTAAANALDDYEEGTWTPTIRGSGTAGTYEIATNISSYTKIGRQVTANAFIVLASSVTGGGTGYVQITGLPFAKANNIYCNGTVAVTGIDYTGTYLVCEFITVGGTSILYISDIVDGGSPIDLPVSTIGANDVIKLTITYFV